MDRVGGAAEACGHVSRKEVKCVLVGSPQEVILSLLTPEEGEWNMKVVE